MPKHVVVVGGGVIGGFTAWYLAEHGHRVTVIDRGRFGGGCSHGNCGYVSPSHVIPLARPGQVGHGLRGLLSRETALRIEPTRLLHLAPWLLRFAMRCTARSMLEAGKACHPLLASSAALYRELIARENLAVEWRSDGLLFVFRDRKGFTEYADLDRWLRTHFDTPAEPLEGSALADLEPALKPGLAGAWLYRCDAELHPGKLMAELRRLLESAGVTIREETAFASFESRGGRAAAAVTDSGAVEGDEFVVATGAWTPLVHRQIGVRLPIQPGKGYSITMRPPARSPRYPMILEECHVGITPLDTVYRIGSTMEFTGYDASLDRRRLDYLRRGAAEYLHEPESEPVLEEWCGWRPMTPDGIPYVDRSPRFANVWVAAGHSMLGISMGTGTGRLVAELISGRPPHIDPAPYRIRR